MGMTNNFVRGGQLSLHKYQMIKQVSFVSIFVCFLVYVLAVGVLVFKNTDSYERSLYWEYVTAESNVAFQFGDPSLAKQNFRYQNGMVRETLSQDVLNNPYIQAASQRVEQTLESAFVESLYYALYAFCLLVGFFAYRGYQKSQDKHERGTSFVSVKRLKNLIRKRNEESDLTVEDLPLIQDAETKHIMVAGTTGSGKTNLYNDLLPQISERGNRALVIDTTGDMISKYYTSERGDVIINPFDARSAHWDLFSECHHEYQFDNLAKSIIPINNDYSDPMWKNGSAKLFSVALQKAKEEGLSPKDLHRILVQDSLKDFGRFFEGTDAYTFADPRGEKTSMSFRTTLSDSVHFLKLLEDQRGGFSISNWITKDNEKSWIFVTANEDMIDTLNPLMAAFFNTTATLLMAQKESQTRRIWFVMDELPALQRLKSLQALLAKGRKYGACVFAGLQSLSQFERTYGQSDTKTVLNLFNTKFFFRFGEIHACEQISKWLGEQEVEEMRESLSYGANQIRDGVSLNNQTKINKLVLPTEIAQLPDLSCFVKYPGNYPISKIAMTFNTIEKKHLEFEIKL